MKTQWSLVILMTGLAVGFSIGASLQGQSANAQGNPATNGQGRFQFSAYADGRFNHCFVVDTTTGKQWLTTSIDGQHGRSEVIDKLP